MSRRRSLGGKVCCISAETQQELGGRASAVHAEGPKFNLQDESPNMIGKDPSLELPSHCQSALTYSKLEGLTIEEWKLKSGKRNRDFASILQGQSQS